MPNSVRIIIDAISIYILLITNQHCAARASTFHSRTYYRM